MNTTPPSSTPSVLPVRRLRRSSTPATTVLNLGIALVVAWLLPLAAVGRGLPALGDLLWLFGSAVLSVALLFSQWYQPHIDDRDLDVILAAICGLGGLWLLIAQGGGPRVSHVVGGLLLSGGWLFATIGTRATVRLWPAVLPVVACLVLEVGGTPTASVGLGVCTILGIAVMVGRGHARQGQLVAVAWKRYLVSLMYLAVVIVTARVIA